MAAVSPRYTPRAQVIDKNCIFLMTFAVTNGPNYLQGK